MLVRPAERGLGSFDLRPKKDVLAVPFPKAWWMIHAPVSGIPPERDSLVFVDQPWKGSPSLRASKKRVALLPLGDFFVEVVADAPLAKAIALAARPAKDAKAPASDTPSFTTRPTELHDAKGKIASGYVWFDVAARVPIDRSMSDAEWTNGWLSQLHRARWRPEVERALPPMFRLLEAPQLLFVSAAIAEAIKAATDDKVIVEDYAWSEQEPFPPRWSLGRIDALRAGKEGKAAEDAFWELFTSQGKAKASRRAEAVKHPWWAYAVARCVDHAPKPDTRTSACAHPIVAALYATDVDQTGHLDTRRAVEKHGLSALRYAELIERAIDPSWRKKILRDAGHDASTLEEHEKNIGEIAAFFGMAPHASDAKPKTKASSKSTSKNEKLPPRYAAAPKPKSSPKSKSKSKSSVTHVEVASAVRSDIDAFIPRGYVRLDVDETAEPAAIVKAAHEYVEAIQRKARSIRSAKERTMMQMELGCAWGEQLRRALGWQWASVKTANGQDAGLALISPDGALAHYPFAFVNTHLGAKAKENTFLLLYHMLVEGKGPPGAKAGSYTTVM